VRHMAFLSQQISHSSGTVNNVRQKRDCGRRYGT